MWLYRTGGDAEHPIVLYDYRPDRKAKNAEEFLEGFSGYLHAEGYQGYHKLRPDIRVVGCWAHARRKFDEAVSPCPKRSRRAAPLWRARLSAPNCSPLKKTSKAFPLKRSANSGRAGQSRC